MVTMPPSTTLEDPFDVADESPPSDFWCVVALIDKDTCPILKQSEDAKAVDLFPEVDWFDAGGGRVWTTKHPPGVYRLQCRGWAHGPDMQGEYDSGVDAWQVRQLYVFAEGDLA